MKHFSHRPGDWGKQFKTKDLNNQIKKLDYHFKLSLMIGAFFISASFLVALALGYVLFAGVSLTVGIVLGSASLVWRRTDKPLPKPIEVKPENSPAPESVLPPVIPLPPSKQHSVAKMHEIWEDIVQIPSVKKSNQIQ